MLAAEGHAITHIESIEARYAQVRTIEQARRQYFSSPLERAADAYLVKRGKGKTLIAGYPWFGDWGRDTFIAIRGLCIATGHLEEARDILLPGRALFPKACCRIAFPIQASNRSLILSMRRSGTSLRSTIISSRRRNSRR